MRNRADHSAKRVKRGVPCANMLLTTERENHRMPKVGFLSLGCPKNLVDSEVMMGILTRTGTS